MLKDTEPKIALFIDYDNIAIGLREAGHQTFDAKKILERLLEKGRIIYKRAYADWSHFNVGKQSMHEAGIELIDIPMRRNIGKNSADIRLVVDALDLCYTKEHIDTFVIGSGDSDFSPLVSKLKENDKHVIGFGLRAATSNLLADNCDEFIFYEEMVEIELSRPSLPAGLTRRQHEAFTLLLDAMAALMRENKDVLWGSLVKDSIRRKRPSFSESQLGYSSFSQLLEDAARHQLIGLIKDQKSGGTPVITGFGPYSPPGAHEAGNGSSSASGALRSPSLAVKRGVKPHPAPAANQIEEVASTLKGKGRTTLVSRTRLTSKKKTVDEPSPEKDVAKAIKLKKAVKGEEKGKAAPKPEVQSTAADADKTAVAEKSIVKTKTSRKTTSKARKTPARKTPIIIEEPPENKAVEPLPEKTGKTVERPFEIDEVNGTKKETPGMEKKIPDAAGKQPEPVITEPVPSGDILSASVTDVGKTEEKPAEDTALVVKDTEKTTDKKTGSTSRTRKRIRRR